MSKSTGIVHKIKMDENVLDYETADEAKNLLQNGILVETSKGLVCMSLSDALSSNLNLSVEDLQNVATKLILEQNPPKRKFLQTSTLNFDSDGFSSECSDVSATSSTIPCNFVTMKLEVEQPKLVALSFLQVADCKSRDVDGDVSVNGLDTAAVNAVKKATDSSGQAPIEPKVAVEVHKPPKRRGGWPKGRKRKPELLNLPPKAPATGYNLYLNEQRKLFKDSSLVFHEITKIVGNNWSNSSLEEKKPYLAKAEEDKRRYREELKQYRQSDAYRAYLSKKRKNRMQNNVLSESDMDATDEIDDEDNEELYCRTCDQWFHNLHNKREHLQGRQHTQSVAGEMKRELDTSLASSSVASFSTSLDESSLDAMPNKIANAKYSSTSITDSMVNLVTVVVRRENEIKLLEKRLQEACMAQNSLCKQLNSLRQKHTKLNADLDKLKEHERDMETKVSQLWQVPSWFIITDFNTTETETTDFNDGSE